MELSQHQRVGVPITLEAMDGFQGSMDGLVRFLKDQPFGAVSSIILMNQGALYCYSTSGGF